MKKVFMSELLEDYSWMYDQYVIQGKSTGKIANEVGNGCTASIVLGRLHGHKIPVRSGNSTRHLGKAAEFLSNEPWLRDQYEVQMKSATTIGKELGCQQETVSNYLHDYGIRIRTQSEEISGPRHPRYGKPCSEETKEKIRNTETGRPYKDIRPQQCKDQSDRMKGDGNPRYGITLPESQIAQQSLSLKEYYLTHTVPNGNGRCVGQYFNTTDGRSIWLRSSYETRYAEILCSLGITWCYEQTAFKLPELETSYRPDFYLPDYDLWIEVKGWMTDAAKQKMHGFHETHPEEKLLVIYLDSLKELEHEIICENQIDISKFGYPLEDQITLWKSEGLEFN